MGDMHNSMIEQGAEGGRIVSASAPLNAVKTKTCSKCNVVKPISSFAPNAGCLHGVRPDCRECRNEWIRGWKRQYRKIPEVAALEAEYRKSEARMAVLKKHAQTDCFKKTQRDWIAKNTGKKNALTASRRCSLAQRTPKWANGRYIELFYKIAKLESERTGRRVDVDHIVPLRGKNVCGLHVETNLQLLFKEDNVKKGCRHD